jgi:uncharacterized membrane protein YhaH (DUF805 family)
MNWVMKVLKQYADFNGRAQRTEYWLFVLFCIVVSIVLAIIDRTIGTYNATAGVGLLGGIFSLAVLLPGIGVSVRRLHDTSRSGWWLLIAIIPLIGEIVLLVFMVQDSTPGTNAYGPSPKEQPPPVAA